MTSTENKKAIIYSIQLLDMFKNSNVYFRLRFRALSLNEFQTHLKFNKKKDNNPLTYFRYKMI